MTMFPAGPDPEINNKNNYYNSSSTSSYYGFDGRSCFFHSNHQLGLMNYRVLEQQEGYDYNCCSTATRHHHRQYQAAVASPCCLVGSSSSSSDPPPPPPPPQNHNHNHNRNHIEVVVVGPMADQEDDSRTETESTTVNEELTAAAAGTSTSKDKNDRMQIQIINVQDHHQQQKEIQEQEEGGWLQLSIGSSHHLENDQSPHGLVQVPRRRRSITRCEDEEEDHHQFIELDLLPPGEGEGGLTGGTASSQYSQPSPQPTIRRRSSSTLSLTLPSSSSAIFHHHLPAEAAEADDHPHHDYFPPPAAARPLITTSTTLSSPLFLQQYYPGPGLMGTNSSSLSFPPPPTHHPRDHINNWAFRSPNNNSIIINPTNYNNIASSSLMPPVLPSSYFMSTRPFQLLHGHGHATTSTFDFRVVDPPRRPHSGIWFMLQASHIQAKEPFLPQIPKSYLRIKDGRMTVRFIIKYLVKKLRLDSETEIEIRCRGQQLVPFLTLQHVRDSVWMMSPTSPSPGPVDTPTLTPTSDHLMVLHYGRMS